MPLQLNNGTRVMRCPECGGDAFHSLQCRLAPGSDYQGGIRNKKDPKTLINLSLYHKDYFANLQEILAFCAGEEEPESITVKDFGMISRREYEYSGTITEAFLLFPESGKILVCQLFGEHRYSENTSDPASVIYIGYTPKEGIQPEEVEHG